jgi:hypothetical protein
MSTPPRTYATPGAFKHALEDRLRAEARRTTLNPGRLRQILIFDRLLGRLFLEFGDTVVAKGGVALELRLARARTTRDVDVRLKGHSADVLERLRAAHTYFLPDILDKFLLNGYLVWILFLTFAKNLTDVQFGHLASGR